MKNIDLKKLIKISNLIKLRTTGPPQEFAYKVGVSRSSLFLYLNYLRFELGADIIYDKFHLTYLYLAEPKSL